MLDVHHGDIINIKQQCSGDLLVANTLLFDTAAFGSLLVCPCDHKLLLYKLDDDNGKPWRELSAHTKKVTCVRSHPSVDTKFISSSLDHTILVWDYVNQRVDLQITLDTPVYLFIPSTDCDLFYSVVQGAVAKPGKLIPPQLDHRLATYNSDGTQKEVLFDKMQSHSHSLCLGNKGNMIVAVDFVDVLVCRLKRDSFRRHRVVTVRGDKISSLAAHPTSPMVAAASSGGKIHLLHNVYSSNNLVRQIITWHVDMVSSLLFSLDGSVLYSGGKEAVLVKWDITPDGGQSRDFYPRLGGTLKSLSLNLTDGSLCISVSDNSVLVLDPSFQKVFRIYGLSKLTDEDSQYVLSNSVFRLTTDPVSQCVVKLSGTLGTVQFFSVLENRHLTNLDIVRPNFTVVKSLTGPVCLPNIQFVVFSDCGRWLVTNTTREDKLVPENILKFWFRVPSDDDMAPEFNLVCEDDLAESDALVSLAFQPKVEFKLVGCTASGKLMSWRNVSHTEFGADGKPVVKVEWQRAKYWTLGTDYSGGFVTFSPDGDLLLSSHQLDHCLSLWNTLDLSEHPKIYSVDVNSDIKYTAVLRNDYVLCCTETCLYIWNSESRSEPVVSKEILFNCASYNSHKDLLVICSSGSKLLVLIGSNIDTLSTIDLVWEFTPVHLCILDNTIVFLSSDDTLLVYPEVRVTHTSQIKAESCVAKPWWTENSLNVNKLSGIFQEPVFDEIIAKRLETYVSAESFAAPNLTKFVSENIDLQWRALMNLPSLDSDPKDEENILSSSSRVTNLPIDEDSEDDEKIVKHNENRKFNLSVRDFERALLQALETTEITAEILMHKGNMIASNTPDSTDSKKANQQQTPVSTDSKKANQQQTPVSADSKKANQQQTPVSTDSKKANQQQTPVSADSKKANKQNTPVSTDSKKANQQKTPVSTDSKKANQQKTPQITDTDASTTSVSADKSETPDSTPTGRPRRTPRQSISMTPVRQSPRRN